MFCLCLRHCLSSCMYTRTNAYRNVMLHVSRNHSCEPTSMIRDNAMSNTAFGWKCALGESLLFQPVGRRKFLTLPKAANERAVWLRWEGFCFLPFHFETVDAWLSPGGERGTKLNASRQVATNILSFSLSSQREQLAPAQSVCAEFRAAAI